MKRRRKKASGLRPLLGAALILLALGLILFSSISSPPRIGVIPGHWGSDPGALCPDGLAEADVNMEVARRLIELLEDEGYKVDMLEEYSPRLHGYRADLLLSIHSDSCLYDFSGFKAVSYTHLTLPTKA